MDHLASRRPGDASSITSLPLFLTVSVAADPASGNEDKWIRISFVYCPR